MNNDTEELRIAKTLIAQLLDALPQRRDWLDPDIENCMRELVRPEPPDPEELIRARNALKHIHDIVSEKDAAGIDIGVGSTAMKSILRWASGDLKDPLTPEPEEIEIWVHPQGSISRTHGSDPSTMLALGYILRRATLHPVEE
jgi:hypothetical protein